MFIKDRPSEIEKSYQETYASEMRTQDVIAQDLETLMDDFSLTEETIGDFEFADWIN